MARLGSWIEPFPEGIYVKPADAWVDPSQPKEKALVTHGHADHARGGHEQVWATPETLAIMGVRYGPQNGVPMAYGEVPAAGRGGGELRSRRP
jgi:putative mRNA 3-end processing factor